MKKINLGIICLIVMLGFVSGCKKNDVDSGKIKVVSTTGMINDIVVNIGGDKVASEALMGPGVDPHLFKASAGDVGKLSKADIIFYNGLHLEAKLVDIFEKMSEKRTVVAVTQTIAKSDLRSPPEFDGFHDPHVWFDVKMWVNAAEVVLNVLSKKDPENEPVYKRNASLYAQKLMELNNYVILKAKSLKKSQRVLVTAHDAFGYFGAAYDFKVVGLQGISTETEAGTKDVQNLAQYIVDNKIPAIFVESSVPERNIKAVQAAAKSKGWNVNIGGELFADAMGTQGTSEGTYLGMVKHNIDTIVNALSEENSGR